MFILFRLQNIEENAPRLDLGDESDIGCHHNIVDTLLTSSHG